ncbi:hypothetical protein JKP88DRAFT_175870, partial [Tribonema minus]
MIGWRWRPPWSGGNTLAAAATAAAALSSLACYHVATAQHADVDGGIIKPSAAARTLPAAATIRATSLLASAAPDPAWIEAQCPNAFKYHTPECSNGGTLYVYNGTESHKESSCAHCDCPEGWGGLSCNLCTDVGSCPPQQLSDGTFRDASACTSSQLLPTPEEAQGGGKLVSCTCGGGEDDWSALLCAQQPDTRLELTVRGFGNATHPATIDVIETAAIRRKADEAWPGQYDYWFPAVFNGSLTGCEVSVGKCLDIPGTTLAQRDCTVFACAATRTQCPPPGYDVCDGFPDCRAPPGAPGAYKTHKCDAIPQSGKAFTVTCEVAPTADGRFVCYYQQPGGFAPLSVTCAAGGCVYDGGAPI